MRVLVCGGRDFRNYGMVIRALDALPERPTVIIHGCARGADTLGETWAIGRDIPTLRFPAHWDDHGPAAGPIRNKRMLDEGKPDLVIAFPGGKGTANMVSQARAAGVKVIEITPSRESQPR